MEAGCLRCRLRLRVDAVQGRGTHVEARVPLAANDESAGESLDAAS